MLFYNNKDYRFYLFEFNNLNYCYDCFSNKIYKISSEIYKLLMKKKYREIKKGFLSFIQK